ncbi:hypothetical protein [Apibacter adventoris]|uniref:Uncharacterized protein n=1 Tax=Apibacter adventoris TaxID=1679466 RepID=A0A2S8AH55_9FLAO|nr:hypothetical protein [Apibacter adventoris]PQL95582.1 hypothetical protein C4S77_01960 [Apibacter adventoris]
MNKKIILLIIGLCMSVFAVPLTYIVGKLLIKYFKITTVPILKPIMLSTMVVGLTLVGACIGHIIVDRIVKFHKTKNSNNLTVNLVKYFVENHKSIENFIIIFFLCLLLFMLYGIWIKEYINK